MRGCGGLVVELEGEGLIAIAKCCGSVNRNNVRRLVRVLTWVLSIKRALASTNLLYYSTSACAFGICYDSILLCAITVIAFIIEHQWRSESSYGTAVTIAKPTPCVSCGEQYLEHLMSRTSVLLFLH